PSLDTWPDLSPTDRRITSSSGRLTGILRNNTWSASEKIVVLAPTPRAKVAMATAVNAGFFRRVRAPKRRSCQIVSINMPGLRSDIAMRSRYESIDPREPRDSETSRPKGPNALFGWRFQSGQQFCPAQPGL